MDADEKVEKPTTFFGARDQPHGDDRGKIAPHILAGLLVRIGIKGWFAASKAAPLHVWSQEVKQQLHEP